MSSKLPEDTKHWFYKALVFKRTGFADNELHVGLSRITSELDQPVWKPWKGYKMIWHGLLNKLNEPLLLTGVFWVGLLELYNTQDFNVPSKGNKSYHCAMLRDACAKTRLQTHTLTAPELHFISLLLDVKSRTLRKANFITVLAKNPMWRSKDMKEGSFSFICGRKTAEIIPRKTHAIR